MYSRKYGHMDIGISKVLPMMLKIIFSMQVNMGVSEEMNSIRLSQEKTMAGQKLLIQQSTIFEEQR